MFNSSVLRRASMFSMLSLPTAWQAGRALMALADSNMPRAPRAAAAQCVLQMCRPHMRV